jgi:hypothetical protein
VPHAALEAVDIEALDRQEHRPRPEHDLALLTVLAHRGQVTATPPDDGVQPGRREGLGGEARVAGCRDEHPAQHGARAQAAVGNGVPAIAEAAVGRQLLERGQQRVQPLGGRRGQGVSSGAMSATSCVARWNAS